MEAAAATFYATSKSCIHFPHESTPVTQPTRPTYRRDSETTTTATCLEPPSSSLRQTCPTTLIVHLRPPQILSSQILSTLLHHASCQRRQTKEMPKVEEVIKYVRNLLEGQIKTPGAMPLASKVSVS